MYECNCENELLKKIAILITNHDTPDMNQIKNLITDKILDCDDVPDNEKQFIITRLYKATIKNQSK